MNKHLNKAEIANLVKRVSEHDHTDQSVLTLITEDTLVFSGNSDLVVQFLPDGYEIYENGTLEMELGYQDNDTVADIAEHIGMTYMYSI